MQVNCIVSGLKIKYCHVSIPLGMKNDLSSSRNGGAFLLFFWTTMNTTTKITSYEKNTTTLDEQIQTYIQVFWEAPWNEWRVDEEGKVYPLSCPDVEASWRPYYNPDLLKQEQKYQSQKQWYVKMIATVLNQTNDNECVWFTMWWLTTLEKLNEEKLGLTEVDFDTLQKKLIREFWFEANKEIFYGSEMWVRIDQRGRGVASKLYDAREQEVLQKNWSIPCLIRTTKSTDVPYKRYLKKGYEEIYEYNDDQDRVLLMKLLV